MVQGRLHFSPSSELSRHRLGLAAPDPHAKWEMIRRMASYVRLAAAAIVVIAANAAAQTGSEGYTTVASASSFDSTLAHLERAITSRGLTIAMKIDHAAAGKEGESHAAANNACDRGQSSSWNAAHAGGSDDRAGLAAEVSRVAGRGGGKAQ